MATHWFNYLFYCYISFFAAPSAVVGVGFVNYKSFIGYHFNIEWIANEDEEFPVERVGWSFGWIHRWQFSFIFTG